MPALVSGSATRAQSPPSGSERSFVSAESENTSSGASRIPIGQLSATSSSSAVAPKNSNPSPKQTKSTNGISDIVSPSSPRRSIPPTPPPVGSYFSSQPGTSGTDPRSPPSRRAPASRSSHGIETATGPPPALSTQRSYTGSSWRNPASNEPQLIHPPLRLPSDVKSSIDSMVKSFNTYANGDSGINQSKQMRPAGPKPTTGDGITTEMEARKSALLEDNDDQDTTVRMNGRTRHFGALGSKSEAQDLSQSSHEDLFLNLARDDSVIDEPSNKSERRRSRVGASSFSQARPARPSPSSRPSTSGGNLGGHQTSSSQNHSQRFAFDSSSHQSPEKSTLASLRDNSSNNRPYAASAHPLDQRNRARNARASFDNASRHASIEEGPPETPRPYARRRSFRQSSPEVGARNHKQSNLSCISNGDYRSSPVQPSTAYGQESHRETNHAAGTESTVSTTAPSTVWDELDDLKSRLRKLELTGILPKSSNAAMSNVLSERPPTATTTMTTMSSSPKRRQVGSISPELSTIKNPGVANLHPLLHSALAKAKPVVRPSLYRALEASALEALNLAAITGTVGSRGASPSPASVVGSASTIDRQLRRKADNMCRSLTELCIALTEEMSEHEPPTARSGSRDTSSTEVAIAKPRLLRETSDETDMSTSSRVMSRLEARRASLLSSSPLHRRRQSPQESTTPTQTTAPSSGRTERTTSFFSRSQSKEGEVDISPNRRPLSRANTEVGQMRPSPQSRISREYTSQHPMPSNPQRSPSVQSALPARKSYFALSTSSPLTPNVQPGSKRYLDRSTAPLSADSARLAEARQRRIASLGQAQSRIGSVPSGRLRQPEAAQEH